MKYFVYILYIFHKPPRNEKCMENHPYAPLKLNHMYDLFIGGGN